MCRKDQDTARRAAEDDAGKAAGAGRHRRWKADLDGECPLVRTNGTRHFADDDVAQLRAIADLLAGIVEKGRQQTEAEARVAAGIAGVTERVRAALGRFPGLHILVLETPDADATAAMVRAARHDQLPLDIALRNAQLTSVAPTGTISLVAGTTAGIEPMFAIAYARCASVARRLFSK